jgi:hypothetical protein
MGKYVNDERKNLFVFSILMKSAHAVHDSRSHIR